MSKPKKNINQILNLTNITSKQIENIKLDNTSGSTELAKQAAEILIFLVENISITSSSKLINLIHNISIKLIKAQPTMAVIFNLVNTILQENIGIKNIDEIKNNINNTCQQYIQQLKLSSKIISGLTEKIIQNDSTIVTHSYSSTLLKTLIYAKETGKNFNIICTESRPMKEGIELAKQLGKKGIKVKLIVDAAIYSIIQNTDLIFIGADAILSSGLVNKIGTHGLAIAAKHYNKKIYALCSIDKILPEDYQITIENQKNAREIISRHIKNVIPINYYFDLTPLELINGVITEKGILSSLEIQEYISKLPKHRILLNK